MAVSIMGMQGVRLKGLATTNSAKGVGKASDGNDFGAMLTNQVSKQGSGQNSTQQPKAEAATKQDGISPAARGEGTPDTAQSLKKPEETAEQPVLDSDGTEKASEEQQPTDVVEIGNVAKTDAMDAAVKEILSELKTAVKDILQLDEEELNLLMEQMGIVMADLFNPQILQQFVVQAGGGEDISALLADESLYGNLKQLQEVLGNIVEESGMAAEEIVQQAKIAQQAEIVQQAEQIQMPAVQLQDVIADSPKEEKAEVKPEVSDAKPMNFEEMAVTQEEGKSTFQFEAVRESDGDARQEGTAQERDSGTRASQPEQFLNLVTNAASENQNETEIQFSQLSAAEQLREIADQILEKVRVIINPSQTSMEITLNPESLGKVSLNLISKQGVMTAQFTAQNQVAREAIESQITVLRENLENQGLKVEAIEVTVSNFEFTQSDGMAGQEQQGGRPQERRNLHVEEAGFLEEVTEEEALAIDILERSGNSVDYTA